MCGHHFRILLEKQWSRRSKSTVQKSDTGTYLVTNKLPLKAEGPLDNVFHQISEDHQLPSHLQRLSLVSLSHCSTRDEAGVFANISEKINRLRELTSRVVWNHENTVSRKGERRAV